MKEKKKLLIRFTIFGKVGKELLDVAQFTPDQDSSPAEEKWFVTTNLGNACALKTILEAADVEFSYKVVI